MDYIWLVSVIFNKPAVFPVLRMFGAFSDKDGALLAAKDFKERNQDENKDWDLVNPYTDGETHGYTEDKIYLAIDKVKVQSYSVIAKATRNLL